MNSKNLDNLVKIDQLKLEPFDEQEFTGLVASGRKRLKDANNPTLSKESRFDLAYNAAHSLALAALRCHGYRARNRYLVFQILPDTTGMGPEIARIFSKCHDNRNLAEYEGYSDIDNQLLLELLDATKMLSEKIDTLKKCVNVLTADTS